MKLMTVLLAIAVLLPALFPTAALAALGNPPNGAIVKSEGSVVDGAGSTAFEDCPICKQMALQNSKPCQGLFDSKCIVPEGASLAPKSTKQQGTVE